MSKDQEYRRAAPGWRCVSTDPVTGRAVKLAADDLGVITITSDEERRLADARRLPITKLPRLDNDEVAKLKSKER